MKRFVSLYWHSICPLNLNGNSRRFLYVFHCLHRWHIMFASLTHRGNSNAALLLNPGRQCCTQRTGTGTCWQPGPKGGSLRHWRRRRALLLVSLVCPWLCIFFMVMPDERNKSFLPPPPDGFLPHPWPLLQQLLRPFFCRTWHILHPTSCLASPAVRCVGAATLCGTSGWVGTPFFI